LNFEKLLVHTTIMYLYIKAIHIIFIVTWFAGLFYIVRLFVYYAEASEKTEPEKSILQRQFALMQRRLWYGITFPSAIITLIVGTTIFILYLQLFKVLSIWLIVKLILVIFLYIYHFICHVIFLQQQKGIIKYSGNWLRMWNEVATLFLVGIVFLVVLKNALSMLWSLVGLMILMIILFAAIRIYKQIRQKVK
jgi:protoporphyrinogen IX oxidase